MTTPPEIKELAERVKKKIDGGMLYGYWVDMNDPDFMIAAAYYCGRSEIFGETRAQFDEMMENLAPRKKSVSFWDMLRER